MSHETTKETLVRRVWNGNPDGKGVMRTETVDVEVTWPHGRPKDWRGFTSSGEWRIVEQVEPKTP